jgi:hypothetical protein
MYVDLDPFDSAPGEGGYVRVGNERERTQLFEDDEVNSQLGDVQMALIDQRQVFIFHQYYFLLCHHLLMFQPSLMLHLPVDAPGQYVLVVTYHSSKDSQIDKLDVEIASHGGRQYGQLNLSGCPYT